MNKIQAQRGRGRKERKNVVFEVNAKACVASVFFFFSFWCLLRMMKEGDWARITTHKE